MFVPSFLPSLRFRFTTVHAWRLFDGAETESGRREGGRESEFQMAITTDIDTEPDRRLMYTLNRLGKYQREKYVLLQRWCASWRFGLGCRR